MSIWWKWGFPGGASSKEPACQCRRHEIRVQSLGQEDALEKGMATHSSILAWRIPWTEEPAGLQSTELHRVRYNWSNLAHRHAYFIKQLYQKNTPCSIFERTKFLILNVTVLCVRKITIYCSLSSHAGRCAKSQGGNIQSKKMEGEEEGERLCWVDSRASPQKAMVYDRCWSPCFYFTVYPAFSQMLSDWLIL